MTETPEVRPGPVEGFWGRGGPPASPVVERPDRHVNRLSKAKPGRPQLLFHLVIVQNPPAVLRIR
jgi:hypothetical protein